MKYKNLNLVFILFLVFSTGLDARTTYKIMPTMDESLKRWIMGGEPYYGDCENLGLTETSVVTLNESQPRYNYDSNGWCSLSSVNFDSLNLEELPNEFHALPNIKTFYLRNNLFEDLNFLRKHEEYNQVYLDGNDNLYDLNALYNTTSGNFYLDEYKQYDLLSETSPFCQGIKDGTVKIFNNYDYNVCQGIGTETAWVNFIRDCSGNTSISSVQGLKDSTSTFNCSNDGIYNLPPINEEFDYIKGHINLTNNNITDLESLSTLKNVYNLSLPINKIEDISDLSGLEQADNLNLSRNKISDFSPISNLDFTNLYIQENETTNLDFLSGRTEIRYLNANDNPISDISGLSSLTSVGSYLGLGGTQLVDLDPLASLSSGGQINIQNNEKLENVEGLSNLSTGIVYVDDKYFTNRIPAASPFCQNANKSGGVDVRINGSNSFDYKLYQICGDDEADQALKASEWLAFFNDNCNAAFSTLSQLQNYTGTLRCENKGLSVSDMPDGGLGNLRASLYLYGNNLGTLDSFKDVTSFGTYFYGYSSGLTDVSGLSNLEEYPYLFRFDNNSIETFGLTDNDGVIDYLYLSNNPLKDISGLSSVTQINQSLNLNGTTITDLSALSNLRTVSNINLRNNENLEDISGIGGIQTLNNYLYFDDKDYTTKIASDSSLCSLLKQTSYKDNMYFGGTRADSDGAEKYYQICDTTQEEKDLAAVEWINFFNTNCRTNYADYTQMQNGTEIADCTSISSKLQDIPSVSLKDNGNESMRMEFDSSSMSDISFLENVKNVNYLNLSSNNISDINNLEGLNYNILQLQSNNLTTVSPLSSGTTNEVSTINVSNNNLQDLEGLENLTRVTNELNAANNDLLHLDHLSNLDYAVNLDVERNSNLTDISGLSGVSDFRGTFELDNRIYDAKIDGVSDICVDSDNGRNTIRSGNSDVDAYNYRFCTERSDEVAANAHAWQEFFNETCNGNFHGLGDMQNRSYSLSCQNKNLTNADIPLGGLVRGNNLNLNLSGNALSDTSNFKDIDYMKYLYLSNNNISDLNGLDGLDFYVMDLSSNSIADLTGLDNLINSSHQLNLRDNFFTNLNPLSNLQSGNYLYLDNNESLKDVSGLQNANLTYLYIDNVIYETRAPGDSTLCVDMKNGGLQMYVDGGRTYDTFRICDGTTEEDSLNADAWLKFFSITCGQSFKNINDLLNYTGTLQCSTKELANSDLPDGGLAAISRGSLNFSNNQLTNFNELRDVTEVQNYILVSNLNTDLTGLEQLERVNTTLSVNSANLQSFNGLDSLSYVGNTIDARNTSISDLNGIDSLQTIPNFNLSGSTISTLNTTNPLDSVTGTLNLSSTAQLNSLDGISSISSINILDLRASAVSDVSDLGDVDVSRINLNDTDVNNYITKAPANSLFCQDLRNKNAYLQVSQLEQGPSGVVHYLDHKLCEQTGEEVSYNSSEWLEFFNSSYCSISGGTLHNLNEMNNASVTANCNSRNMVDAVMPQDGGFQTTNISFNLSSNNLDTLYSLRDLQSIRDLNLSNNSITSLSNLSKLNTVTGTLTLTNNNLSSLSGLDNLGAANSINLSGLTLTNLNGLGSLSSVNNLNLTNMNLSNLSGLSSLLDAGTISLNGSNVTSLNGLNVVQNISALNLQNMNDLGSLSGASSLKTIGTLNLEDTTSLSSFDGFENVTSISQIRFGQENKSISQITDISGLENTMVGEIWFSNDEHSNFNPQVKANGDGAFCQNARNGNMIFKEDNYYNQRYCSSYSYYSGCRRYSYRWIYQWQDVDVPEYNICSLSTAEIEQGKDIWKEFLETKCSEAINSSGDFGGTLNCENDSLTASDFPTSGDPFTGSTTLNLYGNTLTDLAALKEVTTIGTLNAYSAGLTSIDLGSLTSAQNIKLQDNDLLNVDSLQNLTSVSYDIDLRNNSNLTGIYGLRNLTNVRYIYLDSRDYSVKVPSDSSLCSLLRSNSNKLSGASYYNVCEPTQAELEMNAQNWMPFFNENCRVNYATGQELKSSSTTLQCQGMSLTSSDFPTGGDIINYSNNLYLYSNNIGDLDAFRDISQVGYLYAYSAGLTSFNMSSLQIAKYIRLDSNNITSFDLSSLERVNDSHLYLQSNSFSNVDTLSNLTYVRYDARLNSNPNLDSVYGLRNLSSFRYLYLDSRNYSVKAPYSSPLCSTLRSYSYKLQGASYSQVCESQ